MMMIKKKYLLGMFAAASAADVSQAKSTASPPCNTCGLGGEITNPDAVLQLDQFPDVIEGGISCAELDVAGQNGLIPNAVCDLLPGIIVNVCDCQFLSPKFCQFCPNGITIKIDPEVVGNDTIDDGDVNGNTFCQRLANSAKIISEGSSSCEQIKEREQVCCPSNNDNSDDGGVSYGSYSYSYSMAYHAKAAKGKSLKGKYHKSKTDELIRARE
jgi:hypothetical protein